MLWTNKRTLLIDDIIVGMILLFPLLRYYDIPIIGIGFSTFFPLILFGLCGLLILTKKKVYGPIEMKRSGNWYFLFLFWIIGVTLSYEFYSDISVNAAGANYNVFSLLIAFIIGFVIYAVAVGFIDTRRCIEIYSFLVKVIGVIYILQWCLMLVGIRVSFRLPFAITSSWAHAARQSYFGMNSYPTALFSEKSHFCEYVLPYIAMCLFSNRLVKRNRMLQAVLYTVGIVASASGNGIVVTFVIWILYFLFYGKIDKRYRIFVSIAGVVLLFTGYHFLSSIPRFKEMFDLLFVNNTGNEYMNTKADYRIYRGFDLFFQLPLCNKITGVGYNHMYLFSQAFGIVSEYDRSSGNVYEYFSAISMVMLYSGAIGLFACIKHFWALFKSKFNIVKAMVVIMLALWFSTEMLFNCTHLMYILLIVAVLSFESFADKNEEWEKDENRYSDIS